MACPRPRASGTASGSRLLATRPLIAWQFCVLAPVDPRVGCGSGSGLGSGSGYGISGGISIDFGSGFGISIGCSSGSGFGCDSGSGSGPRNRNGSPGQHGIVEQMPAARASTLLKCPVEENPQLMQCRPGSPEPRARAKARVKPPLPHPPTSSPPYFPRSPGPQASPRQGQSQSQGKGRGKG